jgi:hypothetical protein
MGSNLTSRIAMTKKILAKFSLVVADLIIKEPSFTWTGLYILSTVSVLPNKSHICNWYGTSADMTFLERKKKWTSYSVECNEHLREIGQIKVIGTHTQQG